jgi:uncharacterized protein YwgA
MSKENNDLDENEIIERYIILFLGVDKQPIPSILHLEKEIFILSNFNNVIKNFFNFQKHYYGPFSQELKESIEEPQYFSDAWTVEGNKIEITEKGKQIFQKLLDEYRGNKKFSEVLEAIKLVRRMYEKLSREELLFLVYITYPEYRIKSQIFDEVYTKKDKIALSLLKKGLITKERYEEIRRSK